MAGREGWHLLLGVAGAVDHYRSPDATAWHRTGASFIEPAIGGRHWECPALLRFDDRDALVLRVQPGTHDRPHQHVVHAVGRSSAGRFDARPAGPLEHGDALYAPSVVQDASGRWLLWGWVRELVPDAQLVEPGRVGALSLPFVCSVEGERLVLGPAPELAALWDGSLVLELAPGGRERLVLRREPGVLVVDRSSSSAARWAPRTPVRVPVQDRPVDLRVEGDVSAIAVHSLSVG